MTIGYFLVLCSVTVFGGVALLAFYWALRTGQMANPGRGAATIFAPDEPVGEPTDDVLPPAGQRE